MWQTRRMKPKKALRLHTVIIKMYGPIEKAMVEYEDFNNLFKYSLLVNLAG